MQRRKRIALFVGQADEAYQSRFITGFLKKSFAAQYDVCIFAMYRKYQDTAVREEGESNIFSLMNPEQFAGAVILKDSIQTEHAAQRLEAHLKSVFAAPIIVIEKESELFPSLCTDCYSAEYELVSHLIEVHGCRSVAFIGGKKWHKHSKERLQAYRDAMRDHGLTVEEDDILYGDFWYQSGELCAEQLIARKAPLPDGVACANDQMAIGLCKMLTAHGIRVPEDIAVVGYDSTFEGQTSPRSLTSALIPAEQFGEYAFSYLLSEMQGKQAGGFRIRPAVIFGESCGCHGSGMPQYQIRREQWGTEISEGDHGSIFNLMDEELINQSSLPDFLDTVYSYIYQLHALQEFHLCIGSDWQHTEAGTHLPNDGYPQQMFHAIRYVRERRNAEETDRLFPSAQMLPDLDAQREHPCAYFFLPLFFENACFGYAAVSYGSIPRSYDETLRRWLGALCRGFEMLRRNLILNQMQQRLERIKNNKFEVSEHSYESLSPQEREEYQLVARILDENLLTYHFQPIVNAADGTIYAYEALMRSKTEQRISPLSIIRYAAMQGRLSDVERATFLNVLAILNANADAFGNAKIFINSIPGVTISAADSAALDVYFNRYAQQVVVELTEEAELKDDDLDRLKNYFSRLHIDIAVDDYGTGYSNVSNLLRYMPNYVKIDRSLLSGIQNQMQKQHFVREIIDFCHDNHILALAEGIETTEELQTVIHLGTDLIQGYYTARPQAAITRQIPEKCISEIRQYHQERVDGQNKKLYIAGKTNRIPLARLMRDGMTDIVIGQEGMVYKDIAVIGAPQMKTDIHIRIEPGYIGRLTLEDAYFSNIKNRPCIELGEHCDVTLVLAGSSTLNGAGIQVPESSRLRLEGDGALTLDLNAAEFYAIGNHHTARHGELIFEQDGPVNIHTRGKKGICIGSGLGGEIHINRGEFNFSCNNETCIGIGALTGDVSIALDSCHIESDFSVTNGVLIGSLEGNAAVSIRSSAVNHYTSGKYLSGIGTLRGGQCEIELAESGITCNQRADYATCLGALYGATDIRISYITLKLINSGQEALAFGGYSEDTCAEIINSDVHVNISTSLDKDTLAPPEQFRIINGREVFLLNGAEQTREHITTNM
ncbi:MAG: EAL domain-containing protein [Oscillospiraceae bacterium]|nr:EAL domain-containing protein [Oscillospiraceae bacterium]